MPRSMDQALKEVFEGDFTTICQCWRVERSDNEVYAFTNHDEDIWINGEKYVSRGLNDLTAFEQTGDASVSNMNVDVMLDSDEMSQVDIETGLFDHASVEIFLADYTDTSKYLNILKGEFGEAELKDETASIELKSLAQKLQQNIGRMYTNQCDANFGDSRCKVDLDQHVVSGEVDSVMSRSKFNDVSLSGEYIRYSDSEGEMAVEASTHFKYGLLTFDSGLNVNRSFEVKGFTTDIPIRRVDESNNKFGLSGHQLNKFSVGDTFEVINSSGNNGEYTVDYIEIDKLFGYAVDVIDGRRDEITLVWTGGIEVDGTTLGQKIQDEINEDDDTDSWQGKVFSIQGSVEYDGRYEVREININTERGTTEIRTMKKMNLPREVGITYIYTSENIPSSVADGSVRYEEPGTIELFMPTPFKIEPGDEFRIYPGCTKYKPACWSYGNVINFRGFDMIPGRDSVMQVGGQGSATRQATYEDYGFDNWSDYYLWRKYGDG